MDAVKRGQTLRELRTAAGLNQPEVAVEFGVSKQAVSDWEAGRSRPDVRKLRRLDDLYAAGGRVLELFDLGSGELSSLRAALDEERSERRSEVQTLRDQVEALIDQVSELRRQFDVLRGASRSTGRGRTG